MFSSLCGSTYKQVIHDIQLPEELPDGVEYQEGAVQQIKVNRYERDTKISATADPNRSFTHVPDFASIGATLAYLKT